MSEPEEKDGVDTFFDWVDRGVEKVVDKLGRISTKEKEEAEEMARTIARKPGTPPPQKQLSAPADIAIVEPDDVDMILKALKEAVGVWKQRATAESVPERSRAIAQANAVNAEAILEEFTEKLSRGYHLLFKR